MKKETEMFHVETDEGKRMLILGCCLSRYQNSGRAVIINQQTVNTANNDKIVNTAVATTAGYNLRRVITLHLNIDNSIKIKFP